MTDLTKRPLLERCPVKIVDGHLEHDCETKEDRDEMAAVYDQETILRVKPRVAPETEKGK